MDEFGEVIALARQAGDLAYRMQSERLAVEHKDGDEPVTEADRAANRLVVDGLRRLFPGDAVLSEEAADDGARVGAARVWMVDPIDGTKDYIRGESGFSTMIGRIDRDAGDRPCFGVVYQPSLDRLYYASRGHGCFVIERGAAPLRLHVSDVRDVATVRIVASKSHRDEKIDQVRQALGTSDEINVGSVGLKLGLIARGERDLYVNPQGKSKLWDACAPEVLLVEAGGRLTDTRGDLIDYRAADLGNRRGLIASNGLIHDEVLARLRAVFPDRPG